MLDSLNLRALGLNPHSIQELWVFLFRIPVILIAAWLITRIARRGIRLLTERVSARSEDTDSIKRAETLGNVARYAVSVIVTLIAVLLILAELGFNLAPFLGAAGVAGLAVGFGAQNLVKDYFTGFFLLLENQIRQGDVIRLGETTGMVEAITLRYVRLRDYEGNVHFIPNGTISKVTNLSLGFSQAVLDMDAASEADLERVVMLMREVIQDLGTEDKWKDRFLGEFEYQGLDRFDSAIVAIRARIKVTPHAQFEIRREFFKRLKIAFDRESIPLPAPPMTLSTAKPREI